MSVFVLKLIAVVSMFIDHLKTSLYVKCPTAIIADIDVVRNAPMRMIQAGVGDMITKANSLAEWEMAGLVNGEYFCRETCELVRREGEEAVRPRAGQRP